MLIIIILLLPVPACMGDRNEIAVIEVPEEPIRDSVEYLVNFSYDRTVFDTRYSSNDMIDVFVYEADGLRRLVDVGMIGADESYGFRSTGGEKIVIAIANCPYRINRNAVSKFDSIELMSFNYADDNPERPLLSGMCTAKPGGCSDLRLAPLLSCVEITSVTNNMDGYRRLEDPRVYLSEMNPSAEVLRHDGFRPSEQFGDTLRAPLPYDVGMFTQYPGTRLYCYPNDSQETTIGTPSTTINFECEIDGRTTTMKAPLPPIRRNSRTCVNLEVDGDGVFRFSFN